VEAPQPAPSPEAAALVFEPQMVKIPAGKFLMGSTDKQAAQAVKDGIEPNVVKWEQPQHTVELSEYYIGKYPITNREYQAFVRDAKYPSPKGWDGEQFPSERGGHPVKGISWDDANAYCKWLSKLTGRNYRLPTEAEWEKAARGTDGRVYPWGDVFDPKKSNTVEAGINDTSDVGNFSPDGDSIYGCADMVGNVWEFCADWMSMDIYSLRDSGVKDPKGPDMGNEHVIRGGSFNNVDYYARCSVRIDTRPYYLGYTGRNIGFRVVSSSNDTKGI
jgi:formylglycine-generating enzyme required for sulfatase activity